MATVTKSSLANEAMLVFRGAARRAVQATAIVMAGRSATQRQTNVLRVLRERTVRAERFVWRESASLVQPMLAVGKASFVWRRSASRGIVV